MKTFRQILDTLKENPTARSHLPRLTMLPVRHVAIYRLMKLAGDDVDGLIDLVQTSPTFAGLVLSAANGAEDMKHLKIRSISQAVNLLKPHRIRAMLLAYSLSALAAVETHDQHQLHDYVINAIVKARAARDLCRTYRPEQADYAYAMGLIQDIGLMALDMTDPGFYDRQHEVVQSHAQLLNAERERFGFDHACATVIVCGRWRAGHAVLYPVGKQHQFIKLPEALTDLEAVRHAGAFAGLLPHAGWDPVEADLRLAKTVFRRNMQETCGSWDEYLPSLYQQAEEKVNDQARRKPIVPEDMLQRIARSELDAAVDMIIGYARHGMSSGKSQRQPMREDIQELRSKAFSDQLTGALNRHGFITLAQRRLSETVVAQTGACCVLVDLDDFKPINDSYGHHVGDQVLRGLAILLKRYVRRGDLIARLGGDEFACLIVGVNADRAFEIGQNLSRRIEGKQLRVAEDLELPLHASIGVVFLDHVTDQTQIDVLLSAADEAMYRRKKAGKHGLCFAEIPVSESSGLSDTGLFRSVDTRRTSDDSQ